MSRRNSIRRKSHAPPAEESEGDVVETTVVTRKTTTTTTTNVVAEGVEGALDDVSGSSALGRQLSMGMTMDKRLGTISRAAREGVAATGSKSEAKAQVSGSLFKKVATISDDPTAARAQSESESEPELEPEPRRKSQRQKEEQQKTRPRTSSFSATATNKPFWMQGARQQYTPPSIFQRQRTNNYRSYHISRQLSEQTRRFGSAARGHYDVAANQQTHFGPRRKSILKVEPACNCLRPDHTAGHDPACLLYTGPREPPNRKCGCPANKPHYRTCKEFRIWYKCCNSFGTHSPNCRGLRKIPCACPYGIHRVRAIKGTSIKADCVYRGPELACGCVGRHGRSCPEYSRCTCAVPGRVNADCPNHGVILKCGERGIHSAGCFCTCSSKYYIPCKVHGGRCKSCGQKGDHAPACIRNRQTKCTCDKDGKNNCPVDGHQKPCGCRGPGHQPICPESGADTYIMPTCTCTDANKRSRGCVLHGQRKKCGCTGPADVHAPTCMEFAKQIMKKVPACKCTNLRHEPSCPSYAGAIESTPEQPTDCNCEEYEGKIYHDRDCEIAQYAGVDPETDHQGMADLFGDDYKTQQDLIEEEEAVQLAEESRRVEKERTPRTREDEEVPETADCSCRSRPCQHHPEDSEEEEEDEEDYDYEEAEVMSAEEGDLSEGTSVFPAEVPQQHDHHHQEVPKQQQLYHDETNNTSRAKTSKKRHPEERVVAEEQVVSETATTTGHYTPPEKPTSERRERRKSPQYYYEEQPQRFEEDTVTTETVETRQFDKRAKEHRHPHQPEQEPRDQQQQQTTSTTETTKHHHRRRQPKQDQSKSDQRTGKAEQEQTTASTTETTTHTTEKKGTRRKEPERKACGCSTVFTICMHDRKPKEETSTTTASETTTTTTTTTSSSTGGGGYHEPEHQPEREPKTEALIEEETTTTQVITSSRPEGEAQPRKPCGCLAGTMCEHDQKNQRKETEQETTETTTKRSKREERMGPAPRKPCGCLAALKCAHDEQKRPMEPERQISVESETTYTTETTEATEDRRPWPKRKACGCLEAYSCEHDWKPPKSPESEKTDNAISTVTHKKLEPAEERSRFKHFSFSSHKDDKHKEDKEKDDKHKKPKELDEEQKKKKRDLICIDTETSPDVAKTEEKKKPKKKRDLICIETETSPDVAKTEEKKKPKKKPIQFQVDEYVSGEEEEAYEIPRYRPHLLKDTTVAYPDTTVEQTYQFTGDKVPTYISTSETLEDQTPKYIFVDLCSCVGQIHETTCLYKGPLDIAKACSCALDNPSAKRHGEGCSAQMVGKPLRVMSYKRSQEYIFCSCKGPVHLPYCKLGFFGPREMRLRMNASYCECETDQHSPACSHRGHVKWTFQGCTCRMAVHKCPEGKSNRIVWQDVQGVRPTQTIEAETYRRRTTSPTRTSTAQVEGPEERHSLIKPSYIFADSCPCDDQLHEQTCDFRGPVNILPACSCVRRMRPTPEQHLPDCDHDFQEQPLRVLSHKRAQEYIYCPCPGSEHSPACRLGLTGARVQRLRMNADFCDCSSEQHGDSCALRGAVTWTTNTCPCRGLFHRCLGGTRLNCRVIWMDGLSFNYSGRCTCIGVYHSGSCRVSKGKFWVLRKPVYRLNVSGCRCIGQEHTEQCPQKEQSKRVLWYVLDACNCQGREHRENCSNGLTGCPVIWTRCPLYNNDDCVCQNIIHETGCYKSGVVSWAKDIRRNVDSIALLLHGDKCFCDLCSKPELQKMKQLQISPERSTAQDIRRKGDEGSKHESHKMDQLQDSTEGTAAVGHGKSRIRRSEAAKMQVKLAAAEEHLRTRKADSARLLLGYVESAIESGSLEDVNMSAVNFKLMIDDYACLVTSEVDSVEDAKALKDEYIIDLIESNKPFVDWCVENGLVTQAFVSIFTFCE